MNRKSKHESLGRRGYTLIELLLALGLTVVVVSAIATAIQIYLVTLTKQQAMVEQKQLARALLMMIENDLRAAIQYKPADYSGLENLIQTQQLMMQPEPAAGEDPPEEAPLIVEEEVAFRPTMLGSSNVIMIDISKLPRLDQLNPMMESDESKVQTPSDVKSVAYFSSGSAGGIESEVQFAQAQAPGGLYRREVDRAVAAFMQDNQLLSSPDQFTQLIAPEVAEIEFRYFDGTDWQTSWDSDEDGGFPMAIEIKIVVDSQRAAPGAGSYSYSGFDGETMEMHRFVVDLPVSEPTGEE